MLGGVSIVTGASYVDFQLTAALRVRFRVYSV